VKNEGKASAEVQAICGVQKEPSIHGYTVIKIFMKAQTVLFTVIS
jgi:hypothetical protein